MAAILKKQQVGQTVVQIARKDGNSAPMELKPFQGATFYNWKQKYGAMEVCKLKRLKALKATVVGKRIVGLNTCSASANRPIFALDHRLAK